MKDTDHKNYEKDSFKTIDALKFIFPFLKPFRKYFVFGMISIFITGFLSLSLPIITGNILDVSLNKSNTDLPYTANFLVILLVIMVVLENLFNFIKDYFFNKMNELTIGHIRKVLYERYLKYPISFYDKERIGELLSRLNTDVSMLKYIFCEQIPTFLYQTVLAIVAISILFYLDVTLTLITLITFPIALLAAKLIGKKVKLISKKIQDYYATSSIYVEETLQNIRTVKTFANESHETKSYNLLLDKIIKYSVAMGLYKTGLDSLGGMIASLVLVFTFWYGTFLVETNQVTFGILITFFLINFLLGESISKIANAYGKLQNSISVVDRIKGLMEVELEPYLNNKQLNVKFNGSIRFENCSFSYSQSKNVIFKTMNLDIKKGSIIGILGPSGVGKSTFIQLILRFYSPTKGRILLDDKPIDKLPLQNYRKLFGVVSQEIDLFGGTIKENISYSSGKYSIDDIIEAAKIANAYDFIQRLPLKFDTEIGEKGLTLSGGQRQRIAIARALLNNPPILIFDEATSSIDRKTEDLIQEALDRVMLSRTSIIITHKMETIRHADKIYHIENGKLKLHKDIDDEETSRRK